MSNRVKGQSLPRQDVFIGIAKALDVDIRELFEPTKIKGEEFNGFVEYQGEIHRIASKEDLKELWEKVIK